MLRIDQVDSNFLMVVLLLQFHLGTAGPGELVLQGFLSMTGEGWPGGGAGLPAAMVALRHVQEYPGLLDDYNLTFNWEDSEVSRVTYINLHNKPSIHFMHHMPTVKTQIRHRMMRCLVMRFTAFCCCFFFLLLFLFRLLYQIIGLKKKHPTPLKCYCL